MLELVVVRTNGKTSHGTWTVRQRKQAGPGIMPNRKPPRLPFLMAKGLKHGATGQGTNTQNTSKVLR